MKKEYIMPACKVKPLDGESLMTTVSGGGAGSDIHDGGGYHKGDPIDAKENTFTDNSGSSIWDEE